MANQEKYQAKIEDYGVKEVGDKTTVEIYFVTSTTPAKRFRWTGWFTEKGMKSLEEVLATCGLTTSLADVADGPAGKSLDMQTEYSITVQPQVGKDGTPRLDKAGAPYMEVRFVNKPRTAKFDETLKTQAKSKLKDFEGKWTQYKAEHGIKGSTTKPDAGF